MTFQKSQFVTLFLLIGLLQSSAWAVVETASAQPVPPSSEAADKAVGNSPDNHVRYLSYEEAVHIALNDNVDLLALRSQEEALKYSAAQALAPNEPTASITNSSVPGLNLTQTPAQKTYGLNWTLGFPGKAISNSNSIRGQAAALSEQAFNQEVTIMTTLSNNYVAFVSNDAFYKFLINEQQKYKDLIKLIEKKFSAGQASKVDLLNAKVSYEQIGQAILENRNDYDVQLTLFRQTIRRPADKTLAPRIPDKIIIPTINQSLEDLTAIMLKNNHTVAAAARTVDSQHSLVTNAELQALPDLQLSLASNSWEVPSAEPNPGVAHDYTMGITLVIPIFFPLNEAQGLHAARKNLNAAEYQQASQQLQAISALQTAYTSLVATLKDLDTSERLVVPAAKASFDLTLLTYGYGKADYITVNQARQAWHEASRDMLTKRQNAAQLYNQIISQMGCDISKTEGSNVCKK